MKDAKTYLDQIGRVPLLTREEENELAKRWNKTGDEDAARRLVEANLRFVVKVAMGYRRHGLPLSDLVQEGNLGLMQAVRNFDAERGTRLITYAVWWIKAYIQAAVLRSWSLVRVGTTQTQRRLFYRLPRANDELLQAGLSESERVRQLANDLMAREPEVRSMLQRLRGRDVQLDQPLGDENENGATLLERLPTPNDEDPERIIQMDHDAITMSDEIHRALALLNPRERHIIELRHLSEDPVTLRSIGDELGISRERVRQLEAQALERLRRILAERVDNFDVGKPAA